MAEVAYFDLPIKEEYQDVLFAKCEELGVMPEVIASMIIQESNGREDAIGDGGRSFGLMQIQPRWWEWLAEEIGADIKEPKGNIETGVHIVAYLLEKYDGDMGRALTAYNSGNGDYIGDYAIEVLERIEGIELISIN